jgi:hydroxymethylpyrimidine pyrophosphatase-like HAD family hydrolase
VGVKLSVIALDYDGTITKGDGLEPAVREAIAAARTNGIVVLLVTGRILEELERAAGSLHFVDGVVAENGAVLYFPASGHLSMHAPLIPAAFVQELGRQKIPHQAGRCLVDADASEAPRILAVIRSLELPLVLAFNGGRVMTLAQGISKATGLHALLDMLRLSARNTLAIGDRENDHELLRLAEVGVAVGWGSPALRAAADAVIEGPGPPAVASYIRGLIDTQRLPVPVRARRRLRLGHTEDGREFSLAVRGRNVLVAGDANSGKSWIAGLLCEQLILYGYSVCVIDPEGDYRSLEALPGVTLLGGEDPPPTPRELLRALRYPDRSVVIDLSRRPHDEKIEYIRAALPALNEIRRQTGLPHRIVLDEAHYFLHDADAHALLDFDRNGYTIVTYWASRLPAELLARTEVMLVTHESSAVEVEALRKRCVTCQPADPSRWAVLGRLGTRQAAALPITEEAGGDLQVFTFGARLTRHVRHREKYVDVPVAETKAFFFGPNGHAGGSRARTLRQFVSVLESSTTAAFDGHLRRGDFSRWIGGVFGDHALAARLQALERDYLANRRAEVVPEIVAAIRGRYDLINADAMAVS